ncbi:hypothetical protein CPT_Maja_077 [Burkholderia phage Maja]|uniref:Uncharacterized protein n=1 Tax=Burkholderia phage Maja TaxID=2767571 RepID=A0A7S6U0A6_9CAUD|nr:hypothetical protein CPT_Maja_077 [Burkholderia phage Maja]
MKYCKDCKNFRTFGGRAEMCLRGWKESVVEDVIHGPQEKSDYDFEGNARDERKGTGDQNCGIEAKFFEPIPV